MKRRFVLRLAGVLALFVVAVLVGGWLAFVPGAKEPGYEFVTAWGGKGAGPGEFHDPTGIAVTGGEVFVADARNNRIQAFDYDGNFNASLANRGTGWGTSAVL